jgi:hypothetical protein
MDGRRVKVLRREKATFRRAESHLIVNGGASLTDSGIVNIDDHEAHRPDGLHDEDSLEK